MSIIDVQKDVTAKIIEKLNGGNLKPWACPWIKTGEQPIPYNFQSNDSYRGINILVLWMVALEKGYSRNSWLTFKQAKMLGGNIKKGEKGVKCFFYKKIEKDEEDQKEEASSSFVLNTFVLFNTDQVEGINIPESNPYYTGTDEECVKDVFSLVQDVSDHSGLLTARRGESACYFPSLDRIDLPLGSFANASSFASTLSHELGHATGHSLRLDRFSKNKQRFTDSNKAIAFEELVAELFSYMVGAMYGFEGEHLQHESYIASWLKCLNNDHTFIFKAATASGQALDYVLNVEAISANRKIA